MSNGSGQSLFVPIEQDTITFYGHELVAVRLSDGRVAAVLRWLFESLNLDRAGQMQRIERKTALRDGLVRVRVDTGDGGQQEMPALTLNVLPGYLFGIDENRVKAEAREDIILFQRECVEALADHFTRKHPTALPALADTTAATIIIEQIADLTGVINLLREHLEALLILPGQVADLSAQVGETRALVESLADRQDSTETRLEVVDARTRCLSPAHTRTVQEMVDRMVRETKRLPSPLTYAMVYGRLKHRFRVGSYKEVADNRFDELLAYLRDELSRATSGDAPEQSSLF